MQDDRQSRQERLRNQIEELPMGGSIRLNMYPKELRRLQKDYPACSFEIISTTETKKSKMHIVDISL